MERLKRFYYSTVAIVGMQFAYFILFVGEFFNLIGCDWIVDSIERLAVRMSCGVGIYVINGLCADETTKETLINYIYEVKDALVA